MPEGIAPTRLAPMRLAPRRLATLALVLAFSIAASALRAQAAECTAFSGDAGRVCTAAVDASRAFHPLLGVLVSGGNPVLGTGGPLGGPGHVSVTARVNAVEVVLPRLSYDGSGTTVPRGQKVFAPAPQVEAAVGVFGGTPSGLLAVDVLGSAQLLPAGVFDDFRVAADARRIGDVALGLGIGARIGVLRETGPLPGISVSVMRRDLPAITYGDLSAGDQFQYAIDLRAVNLRLVASKRVAVLDLAAGLGWDRYTGDARISVRNPTAPTGGTSGVTVGLRTSRACAFVNAGIGLTLLRLVAEGGYLAGKDQKLSTDFEGFDTTKGKLFAGLGLRVGF
ncbi:MAG: hypothetical protein ABI860_10565 [Gemmatimonadales bacterium]